MKDLDVRFVELENRVAFQERTIELLDQALIDQQKQIDRLSAGLKRVKEMLSTESNIRKPEDEMPPPHSSRRK